MRYGGSLAARAAAPEGARSLLALRVRRSPSTVVMSRCTVARLEVRALTSPFTDLRSPCTACALPATVAVVLQYLLLPAAASFSAARSEPARWMSLAKLDRLPPKLPDALLASCWSVATSTRKDTSGEACPCRLRACPRARSASELACWSSATAAL